MRDLQLLGLASSNHRSTTPFPLDAVAVLQTVMVNHWRIRDPRDEGGDRGFSLPTRHRTRRLRPTQSFNQLVQNHVPYHAGATSSTELLEPVTSVVEPPLYGTV